MWLSLPHQTVPTDDSMAAESPPGQGSAQHEGPEPSLTLHGSACCILRAPSIQPVLHEHSLPLGSLSFRLLNGAFHGASIFILMTSNSSIFFPFTGQAV